MRIALAQDYSRHHTGFGHPERPERLDAFIAGLKAGGSSREDFSAAAAASSAAILDVHGPAYVGAVERFCALLPPEVVAELPTGDTDVSHDSYEVALQAAGAALMAAEVARAGEPSLAIVRPPGHHASPDRGMGFCVFNNLAIAAQRLRRASGPVLIADFDYHHGNGTQAWVERVLDGADGLMPIGFISTHAYPAYPGTGAFAESRVADRNFLIDVPLPLSTITDDFVAVWATLLPHLVRRLRPAAILVSAGFDFLSGDPIAGLPVAQRAVDALCGLFGQAADETGAALTFVLEGGYSLENLTASGSTMAWAFGEGAGAVNVPSASEPASPKLRAMVEETLRWL